MLWRNLITVCIALSLSRCSSSVSEFEHAFVEVGLEIGIEAKPECNTLSHGSELLLGTSAARSVTISDLTNDGLPELLVAEQGCTAQIMLNLGGLEFEDITQQSGLALEHVSCFAVADFDGDRIMDVAVGLMEEEGSPILIYRGDGNGYFELMNIPEIPTGPIYSLDIADTDDDTDYDILVSRPQWSLSEKFMPPNGLLINDGRGNFVELGSERRINNTGHTWAMLPVYSLPLRVHHRPSVIVQNDMFISDTVFAESGGGDSSEHPHISHLHLPSDTDGEEVYTAYPLPRHPGGPMGADFAALNQDGPYHAVFGEWGYTALLEMDIRKPQDWLVETQARGLDLEDRSAGDMIGWGTGFIDFNLDGRPDLYACKGAVVGERGVAEEYATFEIAQLSPAQPDHLYLNTASERGFYFSRAFLLPEVANGHNCRSLAFGDLDNDGLQDVVVGGWGQRPFIYHGRRITGFNNGNWLRVRARRGCEVSLRVHGKQQRAFVVAAGNPYAHSDLTAHFGLGNNFKADLLEVVCNGDEVVYREQSVPANQEIVVP